jgi:hypothetical protein
MFPGLRHPYYICVPKNGTDVPDSSQGCDACPEAGYDLDDVVALEFERRCSLDDNCAATAPPSGNSTNCFELTCLRTVWMG